MCYLREQAENSSQRAAAKRCLGGMIIRAQLLAVQSPALLGSGFTLTACPCATLTIHYTLMLLKIPT